jgi:hypothetical protein
MADVSGGGTFSDALAVLGRVVKVDSISSVLKVPMVSELTG